MLAPFALDYASEMNFLLNDTDGFEARLPET